MVHNNTHMYDIRPLRQVVKGSRSEKDVDLGYIGNINVVFCGFTDE